MKFGLFYLPTYLPDTRTANIHFREIVEQVQFADKIGIDYVWMVEHHFVRHGGFCSSNFGFLSYLAGCTSRIRLGTGATVLPLNDPVRVAEASASLDQLSNGRFDLGIGRGFLRTEFDTFGIEMRESRDRMVEGIDIIKKAWTGRAFNYDSRFRPRIDNLSVLPPPLQTPHPPVWVACFLSKESFEWTAQEGYELLYVAYHSDPPLAKERISWYLDGLKASGRRVEDHEVCCCYHAHFLPTDDVPRLRGIVEKGMAEYSSAGADAAQKAPDPVAYKGYDARQEYHNQSGFDVYFPNRVLMGGPDRVLDRLQGMRDMGITQVSMIVDFGSLPHADIMASLQVFAEQVLPQARKI